MNTSIEAGLAMNENGGHELAILDEAKQALSGATRFDEIITIRDKAEAVRRHAQSASLGLDVQNRAAEVKLLAERMAGQLLSKLMLRGGDRRSKSCHERLKLDDLGISRNQSTRWQVQARVPEKVFVEYVRQTCDSGKELTSAALMRLAKQCGDTRRQARSVNGKNGFFTRRNGTPASINRHRNHSAPTAETEIAETVSELTNHHEVLAGMLQPFCNDKEATLKPAERRMVAYLLHESKHLLSQLQKLQMRLTDCSCHEHLHRP